METSLDDSIEAYDRQTRGEIRRRPKRMATESLFDSMAPLAGLWDLSRPG